MFPAIRWSTPLVNFVHIPKTAGTSVEVILEQVYGPDLCFIPLRKLDEFEPLQFRKYRCWRSHCGPGLLPWLPQDGLRSFTFLRDPVDRFISHCLHSQRMCQSPPEWWRPGDESELLPFAHAGLAQWLQQPRTAFHDNFQTRHLGTLLDLEPWFANGKFAREGRYIRLLDLPSALNDDTDMEQVLARACVQLEQMELVGITEFFSESAELLSNMLGVPAPRLQPAENRNPVKSAASYRDQLAPGLLEEIESRNRYDIRLYAFAREIFSEQLARHTSRRRKRYSIGPRLRLMLRRGRGAICRRSK